MCLPQQSIAVFLYRIHFPAFRCSIRKQKIKKATISIFYLLRIEQNVIELLTIVQLKRKLRFRWVHLSCSLLTSFSPSEMIQTSELCFFLHFFWNISRRMSVSETRAHKSRYPIYTNLEIYRYIRQTCYLKADAKQ